MFGWLVKIFTGDVVGKIVEGVSGHFRRKTEAREKRQAIDAKIQLARIQKNARIELADHEIQVLRTEKSGDSWKDEFVTILVSVPIMVSVVGALVQVGDPETGDRLLTAANRIAEIMTGNAIDFAELWLIVVTVALGTKPLRRR